MMVYYKRIRFNAKNEALSVLQRDVFEETWNTDVSAIAAEIEQLADGQPSDTIAKLKRPRADRRHTCHVLNIAMNLTLAPVDGAARPWS